MPAPIPQKRARSASSKAIRRQNILDAADQLFAAHPSVLPTVAEISQLCELAKGTVYIYFESKEAIFLALLESAQRQWLARLREVAEQTGELTTVVDALCNHLDAKPRLMQLASLSSNVLEPNVTEEQLYNYKKTMADEIAATAEALQPLFQDGRKTSAVVHMLLQTYALLLGLWQLSHPTHQRRGVHAPELDMLQPPFMSSAKAALLRLWQLEGSSKKA
ncbi:TetR family transcriptional regulator [Balneatrix alpica]|uniref:TetR family transcriptional regulator n=1 Tax=Balneatrix alpica TaxID=75684 RepID=A0ABV5Z9V5_9GAMM|nr:TetR family transcriptional regulator [Balneatrix alpica]